MAITVNGKKVAGVGPAGLSPYQVAVQGGYTGTEAEFNQALAHMGESSAADVSFAPGDTGMSADNVQDAVTELFTDVSDGKTAVAAAITDKGVATAATDSFAQMAANIGQIPSGVFEEVDYRNFWLNIGIENFGFILFYFPSLSGDMKYFSVATNTNCNDFMLSFGGSIMISSSPGRGMIINESPAGAPIMEFDDTQENGYTYYSNAVFPEEPEVRYFIMN